MKTLMLLAAAAMTGLAVAAVDAQTVAVRYADLDTSNAAGRATLSLRIDSAANFVCGVAADAQDIALKAAVRQCHTRAVAEAIKAYEAKANPLIAAR